MPPSLIAHLDADCFYVSAERLRDSFLCGKAVGVLGNQGACVIAKSYEMKAKGVGTGEPIWEAVKKCPEGLYVKRDFRWYEVVSKEMLSFVREESPAVEYYSIDEFFMTVDAADPQRFAESIRDRIRDRIGVPVTIGVARTRTLAKLVSDLAKPFGALALLGENAEQELLRSRPVSDITGVAKRSAAKLAFYGIKTCWEFACAQPALIRRILTVVGERLCYELRGQKSIPIQTNRPPHKMISRGGSIGEPSADPTVQWAWAIRNLERLIEAMEFHGIMAGRMTLVLDYKDGPTVSRDATFLSPTNRFDLFVEALRSVWPKLALPGRLYRMHYFASDLQYPGGRQLCLFETPIRDPRCVERQINERFGRFKLRSAATLPLAEIYVDDAHGYEICDVQGKDVLLMDGLALPYSDLPLDLIEQFELSRLVHERGGEKEFRFLRQVRNAILPVRCDGQMQIVSWGCRTKHFPKTGFTWLSTVEAGEWTVYEAQPIEIPAVAGLHNGVWFRIRQGIRGLIVEADDVRAAYMLVEPASYYYKIMTRSERMPVLIGEHI